MSKRYISSVSKTQTCICRLIHKINTGQAVADLKTDLAAAGLSEQEVTAYLVYCAGFYGNMGNYKGFGDSKFVPNLEEDRMDLLVKSTKAYKDNTKMMEKLWQSEKGPMFSVTDQQKQLGPIIKLKNS